MARPFLRPVLMAALLAAPLPAVAQTALPDTAVAQTALPQTLPELLIMMPRLVHAKQMQFGSFSQAMFTAYQHDPSSAESAVPVLRHNLQDADPEVVTESLAVVQFFALLPNGATLLESITPQLASAIGSSNDGVSTLALITMSHLRSAAPDSLLVPTQQVLESRNHSDKTILAAAGALMAARPTSDTTQAAVVAVANDPSRSVRLRGGVLVLAASPSVGPKLIDSIVSTINSSSDKQLRDAAIQAAIEVGSKATVRITTQLNRIANDSTESLRSHQLVHQALTSTSPM